MKDIIRGAFYLLCETQAVKTITVRSIIRKAGINRSTFYYYYRDKQDLIWQLQQEAMDAFFGILTLTGDVAASALEKYGNYPSPELPERRSETAEID